MVGLTDSTIARHSEAPIPGMETTWKETKHNSKYLLSRAPDYIIFSTDLKPSAPAEKALLLFPQFLQCYRTVGWFYQSDPLVDYGIIIVAFKRTKEITGELVPTYPVEWVENYKLGLDEYSRGNIKESNRYLEKAIKASPKPYYPYPIYQMAYNHMQLGNHNRAVKLNQLVLEMDSTVFESHKDLYIYMRYNERMEQAEVHKRWLQKLVPWYWPRLQANVEQQIREAARSGR
jgi:tetratricopeptide (TPR) repeat protein